MFTEIMIEHHDTVGGVVYKATMPALRDERTAKILVDGLVLGAFERALAAEVARGPVASDALLFLRRWLGLKAQELAELLQTTPETISRWERGKRAVDTSAFALVARIVLERLDGREDTLRYLRTRPALASATEPEPIDLGEIRVG